MAGGGGGDFSLRSCDTQLKMHMEPIRLEGALHSTAQHIPSNCLTKVTIISPTQK